MALLGKGMKKLIVKTAVAALLATFSISILILGTLSLTAPRWMEKLAGNLGLVQTEATYALQAYKKEKTIESLSVAVQKNYIAKLYNRSAEYGGVLIARADFNDYCQAQPNTTETFTTKVFLQAITAESYFYIGNLEYALAIAQGTYTASTQANQVVDWLLALPQIADDTAPTAIQDFKVQLQNIKSSTI